MALPNSLQRVLVTGGAGFVGTAVIRQLLAIPGTAVLNFDKLTYAANLASLREWQGNPNYQFVEADICDGEAAKGAINSFQPDAIIHTAAETHVDRSIADPTEFVQTNVLGTFSLLEATRNYWAQLSADRRASFRFLHVSTDEVYGSLTDEGKFLETSPYDPRSPYSASKAGSDHLVRAWHHTYGLPILVTHSGNNFGPYQFPEKLIPVTIINALKDAPLPVYGDGQNVRDWLYVDDHANAILTVLAAGKVGDTYNIGASNERSNLQLVEQICERLDQLQPRSTGNYQDLITFVKDRPGHDRRYAIDARKIVNELGWKPVDSFEVNLQKTVSWYLGNRSWWTS